MAKNRNQSFMASVAFILGAQVAVKLLGLVYRLVITNIPGFGDVGNGYLNAGYQIYTLLLAISSVGIPNAISKMVSERVAVGKYRAARRVFTTALILFAGIGLIASAFMFFGADFIAEKLIKMDGVQYTLRALSPALVFVCVSSVIRGYCLGRGDVKASGTSQVIEQIFKMSLTIIIVIMLSSQSAEIMAAGANLATTIATVMSFLYLAIYFKFRKNVLEVPGEAPPDDTCGDGGFFKRSKAILWLSIPISLSSVITAFARVIDTSTITRGIAAAFAGGIPGASGIPTAAQLNDEAVRLSGMLAKSDVLTNLPLALNIAFATVLVPSVSGALAKGRKDEAAGKVSYSLLISILLVLPCAVGMITLADPIFKLIYPNASAGADLLQLSAVALIFTAMDQTICGSLQGIGRVFVPATGLLCGALVKVVLNIILIRQPSINIYGAAISSIACHMVAFSICLYALNQSIKITGSPKKYLVKPIIANAIMGVFSIAAYKGIFALTHSNAVATLTSIVLSIVVYVASVAALRVLSPDEVEQLPAGDRVLKILGKIGIYK